MSILKTYTMRKLRFVSLVLVLILVIVACEGGGSEEDVPATATLAPIVSSTPRLTATPFSTFTPLPTMTATPTQTPIPPTMTNTIPPTATPLITGIIFSSSQAVNVRQGPGTNFDAIDALVPGTGVIIIQQDLPEAEWYEIEMENRARGWVSARLVRLDPTQTPIPTFTPSPDLTALALGTPLPTAIIGGGTITPTPPGSAASLTPDEGTPPVAQATTDPNITPTATEPFIPVADIDTLNSTATALAAAVAGLPSPDPNVQATNAGRSPNVPATEDGNRNIDVPTVTVPTVASQATPESVTTTPDPGADATSTPESGDPEVSPTPNPNSRVQQGVDVFALCNNRALGPAAPTNIAPGSTVDVYWAWFVSDPQYVQEHLDAVSYEVRVNGELLSNWRQFGTPTAQQGSSYAKYWFVPVGPLEAGEYTITYRATWREQIFDGFEFFGPGTLNPVEEGACTFRVG